MIVILGILGYFFIQNNPDFLNSNGRIGIWKQVFSDIKEGKIILTGAGIGGFKYMFAMRHKNSWFHAHNEYIQLLWGCGIGREHPPTPAYDLQKWTTSDPEWHSGFH